MFINEDSPERVGIRPIVHDDIWLMYKRGLQSIWFVEDIPMDEDIKQWNNPGEISDNIKHFVKYILSFFHGADVLVANNVSINFVTEVPYMEASFFYRFQAMTEDIHSDTYSTMIDALIPNQEEKDEIFNAVGSMAVVKAKADWALRYSDPSAAPLPARIVAFAIMEGVFFSGSFAAIYYIRELGKLPGLCFSNTYIARDEGEHARFAVLLYGRLTEEHRLSTDEIHAMFKTAVDIEKEFMTEAIPVAQIGMSAPLMIQYIEYVADYWLDQLGYPKVYGSQNPFHFMVGINLERKTNMFEGKVAEYARPEGSHEFVIDDGGF